MQQRMLTASGSPRIPPAELLNVRLPPDREFQDQHSHPAGKSLAVSTSHVFCQVEPADVPGKYLTGTRC